MNVELVSLTLIGIDIFMHNQMQSELDDQVPTDERNNLYLGKSGNTAVDS